MAKKKTAKKTIKKKVLKKVPKKTPAKQAPAKKTPAKKAPKPKKDQSPKVPQGIGDDDGNTEGKVEHVDDMYAEWFIDYASYVILERSVPHVNDGLKPVQRRILHALREKEDGSYNKVANIVGHAMQYHPHGDTSIADALVQIGQKELHKSTYLHSLGTFSFHFPVIYIFHLSANF